MKILYILFVCLFLLFVIVASCVIYLWLTRHGIEINHNTKAINFGDISVTVLCTIVGLLVGWNIFSALELKESMEKVQINVGKINDRCSKIAGNTTSAIDDIQLKTKKEFEKQQYYIDGCVSFCQGMSLKLKHLKYYMFTQSISHFCNNKDNVNEYIDSCLNWLKLTLKEMSSDECANVEKYEGFHIAKGIILSSKYLDKKQLEQFNSIESERIQKSIGLKK